MIETIRGYTMLRLLLVSTLFSSAVAVAQDDWAQLERFAEENRALGKPARGEDRVVFLGDSITQGWGDASPDFFAEHPYIERGIAGQTTAQMLVRFRADVVALEPAVVVILAGTNDLAGNQGPQSNEMIQDNLASMAEIATENGIRVVLSSILPADRYPWAPDVASPAFRIFQINRWIEEYTEAEDHVYLDYYSAFVNDSGGMDERYTYDGVHVNADGYAIMEPLAQSAIDAALGRRRQEPGAFRFEPLNDGCPRTSSRRSNPRC